MTQQDWHYYRAVFLQLISQEHGLTTVQALEAMDLSEDELNELNRGYTKPEDEACSSFKRGVA